ncbi:chemotaxis protein methyltransferase WspC [Thiogranum longum]|uniref:Chemotaxis protein methyltransferase WspC n=1 Tax=Thiogranum longum TaxID=1537524 RepID=A0A4R1HHL6_9GAMM|nr:CheR family methyltransferase [Thiogranum longum]TCK18899.1 chemotaxis protein methyltransferase WspC [Thiogranum longum]
MYNPNCTRAGQPDVSLASIAQLLQERMGLYSSTVGVSTIQLAVEQRMRACGTEDVNDYARVLSCSATELDALTDTVIIPETWFFRDANPFAAFKQWLQEVWQPEHAGSTLRILSVPCSSGEEAYTLAMCLSDTGIPPDRARIDAIDISHTNIEKAIMGEYGRNSFRGNSLDFRDRHFQPSGNRYRINDQIREYISFKQANLLDDSFTRNRDSYNVIFCRNLLIYFDRKTQDTAIDRLQMLLQPDGLLFLGHSETALLLNREFSPLKNPRCFGFYRDTELTENKQNSRPRPKRSQLNRQTVAPSRTAEPLPFSDIKPVASVKADTTASNNPGTLLQQAFQLADEGHLGEAAEQCEALLTTYDNQADAYYLLGLIRESTGNLIEAEQLLRKAVYLDPVHHEALVHLGIICEQLGDDTNAIRFRNRATRTTKPLTTEAVK